MSGSFARWARRAGIAVAVLLVAGFAVGSLAGSKQNEAGDASSGSPDVSAARRSGSGGFTSTSAIGAPPAPAVAGDEQSGAGSTGPAGLLHGSDGYKALSQVPASPSEIIKTGEVGIRVAKGRIDRAWDRVFQIAAAHGGFVLSSGQGVGPGPIPVANDDARLADIVIRVPADRFDQAVAALTNGELGKVTRRGFSGQDVSREFVDLDSRLRHLRAQEAVLLRLMARATSIGDTITVQQQLSQIQLQIEEITGRVNYLKDQTRFATVAVHLAEMGAVASDGSDGPSFSEAWSTAVEGLERMGTAALIGATWLSPFLLLGLAWMAARRFRRPATQA
jgi:hypothetical protein